MDMRSIGFGDGKVNKVPEATQETKASACSSFDCSEFSFQVSFPFPENNFEVGRCLSAAEKDLYVHLSRGTRNEAEAQHLLCFIASPCDLPQCLSKASAEPSASVRATAHERMIGGRPLHRASVLLLS